MPPRPRWRRLGPVLYGALFVAVLPVALILWARAAAPGVTIAAIHGPVAGGVVAASGLALILAAMLDLWRRGGGLPMNAFPPPRLVVSGAYALVGHPIYVGFVLVVGGLSVAFGSAAGLWLVTPAAALGCSALVLGHERLELLRRFGHLPAPWLASPAPGEGAPRWSERTGALVLAMLPWVVLYEACRWIGVPADAISTALPFERNWPVLEWAEPVYASAYLVVPAAFLLTGARDRLRTLTRRALVSQAVVFPLFLLLPFVAPPRPVPSGGWLGQLMNLERAADTAACAFPSFHVVLAFLAADALAPRSRLARPWAVAVALSCVAVGTHTVLDVVAAWLVVVALHHGGAIWERIRRGAEGIANAWAEWRVGPVRILAHGLYVGLASAVGCLLMGTALGPGSAPLVLVMWGLGLLGAGLWAQVIEGRGLSRPFGFYGGLLGLLVGAMLAPAFGFERWTALAAVALAGPPTQLLGRFRCLAQGCCHGAPAPTGIGIRHLTPLSRVVKAGLGGVPIHPTALYSILWNVLVAAVVLRLSTLHAPAGLVAGIALFLSGAGRFVEEAYRGEPQTPVVGGLRLYQWLAIGSVVAGAVLTALGPSPAVSLAWPDAPLCGVAALAFTGTLLAMGVDVPGSTRRLARLA